MLVAHPSSRCDVCLEAYTFDASPGTIPITPHAIPCGHIFCRQCLQTVSPTFCPLCRKPYLPDRIKKLHIDQPDTETEDRDVDLIQRLCVAWGGQTPSANFTPLIIEVDAWLKSRTDDESAPLRGVREALTRHILLKDQRIHDRRKIDQLEAEKTDLEVKLKEYEQALTSHVEESEKAKMVLVTKCEQLTGQTADLELQIEILRSGFGQRSSSNPLPPPPLPVPPERLPLFARSLALDSDGNYKDDMYSFNVNGPEDRRMAEAEERMKKKPLAYNIYAPPEPNTQSTAAGIVPGARPENRYIPSRVTINKSDGTKQFIETDPIVRLAETSYSRVGDVDMDPSAPASAYVSGYESGYRSGHYMAEPPRGRTHAQETLASILSDPNVPRSRRQSTTSRNPVSSLQHAHRSQSRHSAPSEQVYNGTEVSESLQASEMTGVPVAPQTVNSTPRSHRSDEVSSSRPRSSRRSTASSQLESYTSDSTHTGTPSSSIQLRAPRMNPRSLASQSSGGSAWERMSQAEGSIRSTGNPLTASSWGTPRTNELLSLHGSTPGSISQLGLMSFPPIGSDRGSIASSSAATSSRDGTYYLQYVEAGYPSQDVAQTPRTRSDGASLSILSPDSSVAYSENNNRAHRTNHRRHTSHSTIPAPSQDTAEVLEQIRGAPAYRTNRTSRTRSRHTSSTHPSSHGHSNNYNPAYDPARVPSSVHTSLDATRAYEAPPYPPGNPTVDFAGFSTGNTGNALGLDLAPGAANSQISAPTPVTSSRLVSRSYSNDTISR